MARPKGISANPSSVKELRELKAMSQERLSSEANVSRSVIQRLEQGKRISHPAFKKIAEALNTTPESLIGPPPEHDPTAERTNALSGYENNTEQKAMSSIRDEQNDQGAWEIIRLAQTKTAKEIIDISRAGKWDFDYSVELDQGLGDLVASFYETIEQFPTEEQVASGIRQMGLLQTLINKLAENEIYTYIGTYEIRNGSKFERPHPRCPYIAEVRSDLERRAVIELNQSEKKTCDVRVFVNLSSEQLKRDIAAAWRLIEEAENAGAKSFNQLDPILRELYKDEIEEAAEYLEHNDEDN